MSKLPHARRQLATVMTPRRRQKQAGAATLILASVVALAAGTVSVLSYLNRSGDRNTIQLDDRRLAAGWATDALVQYMQLRGRLPCVAKTVGGPEDCSAGAKGYLPVAELERAVSGGASRFGQTPLVYVIYKGAGTASDPDFSTASEAFSPVRFDGTALASYSPRLSSFDLCGKLRALSPAQGATNDEMGTRSGIPARTDRSHLSTVGPTGATTNKSIVFGVAAQGASSPPAIVSDFGQPALPDPMGASADEQASAVPVDSMDARTLFLRLRCGTALSSANLVADAQDLTKLAASQKASNSSAAEIAVINQQGFVLSSYFGTVSAVVDMYSANELAATNAANAVEKLPLAPLYIWGMTEATLAWVIATVDLGRNIIGAALDESYWLAYVAASERAKGLPYWSDSSSVLGQTDAAGISNAP